MRRVLVMFGYSKEFLDKLSIDELVCLYQEVLKYIYAKYIKLLTKADTQKLLNVDTVECSDILQFSLQLSSNVKKFGKEYFSKYAE